MQKTMSLLVARLLATAALATCALAAGAQELPVVSPRNVLQLSAAQAVKVQQDLLSITLATSRDGPDAAGVQRQLTAAVDAALAQLKPAVKPGQFELHTGHFGLSPRWNRDGRMDGWTGTAEVVVEGRDVARIAQVAGQIQTLTIRAVSFGLSREARARAEQEAQAMAVDRFRAKADELAHSFGFSGYGLREVAVSTNDQGIVPMRMALPAAAGSAAPVPVEPGRSSVMVTVTGSVQMR